MLFLIIGDPHFKSDNSFDTELLCAQILAVPNINVIVLMGDQLHRFEKIDLYPLLRVTQFLTELRKKDIELFILIGNHDRPNKDIFLTDEHAFNSFKAWPRTHVIDTVTKWQQFLFIPYVPTGRLNEALLTCGFSHPLDVKAVFMHQECFGAQMGGIVSITGDVWPKDAPLAFSGHIHDYQELQSNFIYVGASLQQGYSDQVAKTVSTYNFTTGEHVRLPIQIPRCLCLTIAAQELLSFQVPVMTRLKLKVKGDSKLIRKMMQNHHVVAMIANGVKIVIIDESSNIIPPKVIRSSLRERIEKQISSDAALIRLFTKLFP